MSIEAYNCRLVAWISFAEYLDGTNTFNMCRKWKQNVRCLIGGVQLKNFRVTHTYCTAEYRTVLGLSCPMTCTRGSAGQYLKCTGVLPVVFQ